LFGIRFKDYFNGLLVTKKKTVLLGPFIDQYIGGRTDVKPRTKINYNQTRQSLIQFFGESRPLNAITPGEADDFRLDLLARLGDNTVRRRCSIAKQFFRAAARKKLIQENPFADMKGCGVRENRERDYFITREETAKVLAACPDSQWRLLFALSRFGGLRCPSEHLGLRWGDVDWEGGRFTVHSPKTEHHDGKDSRLVPIFPELRPYLEEVFEQAAPGTEWVITRYRDTNANLRTQLQRIIAKAGLTLWPKLFQNLRATRATELVGDGWPEYKVCKWLGHGKVIAERFYWQVTDEDFRKAAGMAKEATYNTTHPAHVRGGNRMYQETQNPGFSGVYATMPTCTDVQVAAVGVEPTTRGL
jgi:integrase